MSTLYELTEEALALRATLEDAEGDLDALGRQFAATLDANDAELARKLDGYCALILDYQARERVHSEAAAAQDAKAKHCAQQADWLSDNLRHALERLGIKKHDGVYRASVCKNSTVPVLIDEAAVPEQYKRVKVDIDRLAIRDALKSGATLPFARWGEAGTHLRVS